MIDDIKYQLKKGETLILEFFDVNWESALDFAQSEAKSRKEELVLIQLEKRWIPIRESSVKGKDDGYTEWEDVSQQELNDLPKIKGKGRGRDT